MPFDVVIVVVLVVVQLDSEEVSEVPVLVWAVLELEEAGAGAWSDGFSWESSFFILLASGTSLPGPASSIDRLLAYSHDHKQDQGEAVSQKKNIN